MGNFLLGGALTLLAVVIGFFMGFGAATGKRDNK